MFSGLGIEGYLVKTLSSIRKFAEMRCSLESARRTILAKHAGSNAHKLASCVSKGGDLKVLLSGSAPSKAGCHFARFWGWGVSRAV